jgi:exonuclease SbcD
VRLLHTSDWHLGRSFHREDLLGAQATYIDHLLAVIATEKVDVLLVSGDVYDRALPPVDAVRLADEAFARLASAGVRVVVTSGNHDSAIRLGFNSGLADASGIHFRTRPDAVGQPVLIDDASGPIAFYGLPYLEPQVLHESWELSERSHQATLSEAMRRVRADLGTRPAGTRSVVLAHAFVGGSGTDESAVRSDSERDISVGGVQLVATPTFDGIDYVALGHLHGRQTLSERVRYSGSPLAYSFSERRHTKGSWLIDLSADGSIATEFVEAPVPRAIVRLEGELASLLTDPAHAHAEDAWVDAILTDTLRPLAAMDRLRERFPHALQLTHRPATRDAAADLARPMLATRSDHEIALQFFDEVRQHPADTEERALLRAACDACRPETGAEAMG